MDDREEDEEEEQLQLALTLSLQDRKCGSHQPVGNTTEEANRKRRHEEVEGPSKTVDTCQPCTATTSSQLHTSSDIPSSSSAAGEQPKALQAQKACNQGTLSSGNASAIGSDQPDAKALASQLQGILSEVQDHVSSTTPFSGLCAEAGAQTATNAQTTAESQMAHPLGSSDSGSIPRPSTGISQNEIQDFKAGTYKWAAAAESWVAHLPGQARCTSTSGLDIPESSVGELGSLLSDILQMPVALVRAQSSQTVRRPAGALTLLLAPSTSTRHLYISDKAFTMLLKRRMLPAHLKGTPAVQFLADCHTRACKAALHLPSVESAAACLHRWQLLTAEQAMLLQENDDEEDLYFTDGGHHTKALLHGLGTKAISVDFLGALLQASTGNIQKDSFTWEKIIRIAFKSLDPLAFTDHQKIITALQALTSLFCQPLLQHALAAILVREARAASTLETASEFEESSVIAPLLRKSPIPEIHGALSRGIAVDSKASQLFEEIRMYDRPGSEHAAQQSIRQLLLHLYETAQKLLGDMARQKQTLPRNCGREALLAWLAAAVNLDEVRASGGEGRGAIALEPLQDGSSDGFAVGLAAVGLHFCHWFHLGDPRVKLDLLDTSYYHRNCFRWHTYGQQTALTGQRINTESNSEFFLAPDRDPSSTPHFAAECFFLMQLLLHNCLLPAVVRYEQAIQISVTAWRQDTNEPAFRRRLKLIQDCNNAQLLDPLLAGEVIRFIYFEASWLQKLMKLGDAASLEAFSRIPDFVVKDMSAWLGFIIRHNAAELLGGSAIADLMDTVTGMLLRPDLVSSAVVQSHLVELLQAMLAPQINPKSGTSGRSHGPLNPGEAQMVAAVYSCGATQTKLVPGLMRAFTAADHVIGLDVDRDRFDKFVFRDNISALLIELWKDEGCLSSLTHLAQESASSSEAEIFSDFTGSLMDSLIYLLNDCMSRLTEMHYVEVAKKDQKSWNAAGPIQIEKKEEFYRGHQKTTVGFMRLAQRCITMLLIMAKNLATRKAFWEQPLVKRSAHAVVQFINKLAGPECHGMEVEDPAKYLFDPDKLLYNMAELLAWLSDSQVFVDEIANDPEYHEATMQKAHDKLAKDQGIAYEILARLQKTVDQVHTSRRTYPVHESDFESLMQLSFAVTEPQNLADTYKAELCPHQIGTFDSLLPRAYNREFLQLAQKSSGNTQAQMKRLAKEMRDLSKHGLTLEVSAAIFVRHDQDRLDKVRALVIGPEDTPYAGGCFHFDVFFPPDYPHIPPLMVLETTGLGRARFHPNLYADGKVCLSLLGTFHGTDASEKWNPSTSSLYQILMSVMGLIFVADPYFAEPNAEIARGTREGKLADNSYNAAVFRDTLWHAIIDPLKNPRPGFEDVTRKHFKLQRHRILANCKSWLEKYRHMSEPHIQSVKQAMTELYGLLLDL